ncbi:hypothetical protein NQ318_011941 [Aromia moschata]|uniref:Uncharacterized protein n=1 Tax=Aromia moschata TaxID=1265417 RepID=A0AAV8XLP0_9CUCU|nr:hypothetical protein NQ318_011941 [Aromia moschata]
MCAMDEHNPPVAPATLGKYKIRNLKTDDLNYRSYINYLAAFLSLRLVLNHNVHDFMISVNDKDWGAFGDVVVNMLYKGKTILYAIHVSSDFSKAVTLKREVLNKWKTNDDITCDATIELKSLTKKNDLINVTSDSENVYTFLLKDKIECELPSILLYTSQRVVPSMLNQQLKVGFKNYPDISKDFIKYIENWEEGKLGGHYKLRKKDIILKIGEILLTPYIVSPKRIQPHHHSFDIWNNIINNVDLTVVKNEPFAISKICVPLNRIIEETFATNIDTITKSISLKSGDSSILDRIRDPFKSYLFEVLQDQKRDELPLHQVYTIFWKAGKIPLLLSTEDREECKGFIFDVKEELECNLYGQKELLRMNSSSYIDERLRSSDPALF